MANALHSKTQGSMALESEFANAEALALCRSSRIASGAVPREIAGLLCSINACIDMNGALHPVAGRNGRIMPAWRTWARQLEGATVSGMTESLMATPRRRFEQNVALLRDAIQDDSASRVGVIDGARCVERDEISLVLPTAALMFWSRRRMLIEPTEALEQWLVDSDIGADLPCELFRSTVPACFIRFGQTFRDAVVQAPVSAALGEVRLQGVYVFESAREENRAIAIVPIFELPDRGTYGASSLELVINDETLPLNDQINLVCDGTESGPQFASIVQIVAKVFFYMQQPQAVQVEERPYSTAEDQLKRLGVKKAVKLSRQMPKWYDRLILGPTEMPPHAHGELSPHLRRGHFRFQPYGPQSSLRKVIFLAPTWVRADKLA